MKMIYLSIAALAAATLAGCTAGGANDDPVTAAPAPAAAAAPAVVPSTEPAAAPATVAVTPAQEPSREDVQAVGPHIDASAFLNALVESGCQIDKAEYKEVKRGGAIKVVCSRTVDPLNVELDDL